MALFLGQIVRWRAKRRTVGRSRLALCAGVLVCVTVPGVLFAQINLTFQTVTGGLALTGAGTSVAVMSFGTVSAYAPVGAGISRTNGATDYTIGSNFGVRVTASGRSGGPNYNVRARLTASNALTWRVNGVVMTTTLANVASAQPYGSTVPHGLEFVVPLANAAGAVSAVLEIQAVAN
jgi:hypothetical protein